MPKAIVHLDADAIFRFGANAEFTGLVIRLVLGWKPSIIAESDPTLSNVACSRQIAPEVAVLPQGYSLATLLRKIDWFQFEKLVSAVYQAREYHVQRLGGAQPDGGVDLRIEKDGVQTVVQCKHWAKWVVGVRQMCEFLGTLTDAKISNGIFVTLRGFTADARAFAAKHNITLIGEDELISSLEKIGWKFNPEITALLNDKRKFCLKCEREMVLRTASKGRNAGDQFWG